MWHRCDRSAAIVVVSFFFHVSDVALDYPLKFLQGGRSLDSVLSRHTALKQAFDSLHGDKFKRVRDWYAVHGSALSIVDVSPWLSELAEDLLEEPFPPEGV
jgi:hypothetical protein